MGYAIRAAVFPEECEAIRALFTQYQADIGVDLCFQNFAAELRDLPAGYAEPSGFLLGAESERRLIGCVALKPLSIADAEMKRLYVEPAHRCSGIALQLVLELIRRAGELRYQRILLDTLPSMQSAQRLYASLGFIDTEPHTFNPTVGVRYMALDLSARTRTLSDQSC
jgi:ribosomal protein S18 acetylase RimI-like enzyme